MQESHMSQGSWIALGASILLLLTVFAVDAYRYTLPTDGWDYGNFETGPTANVLKLPSDLQAGDVLVAVGGVPIEAFTGSTLGNAAPLPANWRAGETVLYTVERGVQTLTVAVPIGNWNLAAVGYGFVSNLPAYLIALLYFLIGGAVFALRPGNLAAQVLLFLGSVRLAMEAVLVIPVNIGDTGDALAITGVALLGFYIFGILLFPTFLLLSLVFPKPKRPFRTHPLLTVACLYLLEPILLAAFGGMSAEAGPSIGFGLVAVYGLLTVISVLHSIMTERGDAIARAQLLWVGLGVAFVAGFQFVENVVGFNTGEERLPESVNEWLNLINAVIYLAVPIAVAIAILRYRLFDIDIIIRKTLTYALVGALLAVVYFSSVVVLQQVFAAVSGQRSEVITVLSTLGIAALFVPVRNRIQTEIDKRFYRKKYDAQQVLNDFASTVRDETDLEKLTGRLMQVVDETMQPKSVSVWLKQEEKRARGK